VIDLHSHVLPGLDDGAGDLEQSVEMARGAAEDGVRGLGATPHVRDDYPTTPEQMEEALAKVRLAVADAGIDIEIYPGGELAIDMLTRLPREELRRFGLGGNPRYLLVEFPYYGLRLDLGERLFELRAAGFTPVLAHPERNANVQTSPEVAARFVAGGALVQITSASLDGRLGRRSQESARTLLERGLAHMLASDAHAPEVRAIGMSAAAAAVGDEELAHWLTEGVPGAIVADEPVPPRPEVAPAKKRRRFFVF
jgi:protein-tyrosine phosphatase